MASSPIRFTSHFGFGLLYRPHVTCPARSSLLARPALRPFPALGPALPAPQPPSSRTPSPSSSQAVAAPSSRQPFPRDASPPPAAVPPPRLPSPRPELTVSKMAAVSVWGISAVRRGGLVSRLSSPAVSSREATPDRPQPSSPRLSRSGARSAASRGRQAAAGPVAACAASRCSAPGLGLGRHGRPLAPGRRPAYPAPRSARLRSQVPAARPRAGPSRWSRWEGRRRAAQAAEPRAGLCRRARSPSGGAPTSPAPPAPGGQPPRLGPARPLLPALPGAPSSAPAGREEIRAGLRRQMGVTGWRVLWCGGGSTCGVVSVGLSARTLGGEAAGCLSVGGGFGQELPDLSGSPGSLRAPNPPWNPPLWSLGFGGAGNGGDTLLLTLSRDFIVNLVLGFCFHLMGMAKPPVSKLQGCAVPSF